MRNPDQIAQFGARLKELRKKAGYTQDGLAFEAGLNTKSIYYMEHGQQAATLDVVLSLARVLGITPSRMLEGIKVDAEE